MKMNGMRSLTFSDAVEINLPVMISAARREIFREQLELKTHPFQTIEDRHLGVMRALLVSSRVDFKTTATVLKCRVMLQNDVKGNVAREQIYEVESIRLIGIKRIDPDEGDRRENIWTFREGILQKYEEYCRVSLLISRVVEAQMAQPLNPKAGAGLVPDYIYFNILDAEKHAASRAELRQMLDAEKLSRNIGKKGDNA